MKKSKYSFKASESEFELRRVIEENVDSCKAIVLYNRSAERKIALVREDLLQNFYGLRAANICKDSKGLLWFVVTKEEAIEEVESYLEYQANRMWFDIYTWK